MFHIRSYFFLEIHMVGNRAFFISSSSGETKFVLQEFVVEVKSFSTWSTTFAIKNWLWVYFSGGPLNYRLRPLRGGGYMVFRFWYPEKCETATQVALYYFMNKYANFLYIVFGNMVGIIIIKSMKDILGHNKLLLF